MKREGNFNCSVFLFHLRFTGSAYITGPITMLITKRWTIETKLYKAVNGMTPNYIQELFEVKEIPYNLSDPTRTIIPKSNSTSYGLKSLKQKEFKFGIGCQ